jgi:uncharacterized protein (DUF58 family)
VSFSTESRISRTTASTGTSTHTRYTTTAGGRVVTAVFWGARAWRAVSGVALRSGRWLRDTVTPAGWLVVAAVLGLPVGLGLGWMELAVAGVVALVVLVAAIPFLFGGQSYAVSLDLSAERVVAGDSVTGVVDITNRGRNLALPGRLDIPAGEGIVELHVPLLTPGASHREQLEIGAHHRGVIPVGPVTSVRTDPIGVLKRELAWVDLHDIYVHPRTVSLPPTTSGFIKDLEGNPSSHIVDSDISFHAIREYAYGDAQRNIHWKSTAKTGTLMVRQYEETRRSRLAVVLSRDLGEYASDDEFELGVSVAASLGVRAIRDGRDVAVTMSDEIPEFATRQVRSIKQLGVTSTRVLLDDLTRLTAGGIVMPVERVCELAAQVINDLSLVFVVVGSKVDPRRLRSLSLKFPANVPVIAVVCDETASPSLRGLSELSVMTVALLDDMRHLLARSGR